MIFGLYMKQSKNSSSLKHSLSMYMNFGYILVQKKEKFIATYNIFFRIM